MMLLEIIKRDYEALWVQVTIIFLCWVIVLLAVGIDLYFGVKKSRENKVYTHSYGYRQTSAKVVQYLAFMFFMVFIDILNPLWVYSAFVPLPIFSIFGAIVLVYTEFKSVREKSSEKFRLAISQNPMEIIKFITENRDLIDRVTNITQQNQSELKGLNKELNTNKNETDKEF